MNDGPKWATIVGVTIIGLFVLAVFTAMIFRTYLVSRSCIIMHIFTNGKDGEIQRFTEF